MARKIGYALDDLGTEYVVEFEDNRDRWKEDPTEAIVADLEPMTGREANQLDRELGNITGRKLNAAARAQKNLETVIERRVKALRGLVVVTRAGEEVAPRNGKELVAAFAQTAAVREIGEIMDDLYEAVRDMSRLRDGLPEALRSQPAKSSETIDDSRDGVVTVADAKKRRAQG